MAMAEEKKVPEKGVKEEKPHGGGNKLLMIVIILLVVLVGGVGAVGYLVMTGHNPIGASPQADAHASKKADLPPVYSKLDTFVVNLSGPGGTLLQVDMQAELTDADAQKKLTDYMPKVRSAVILLLSAKTPEELSTSEGKLRLKSQVKQVINGSMDTSGDEPVKSVVFTSFIIQNP